VNIGENCEGFVASTKRKFLSFKQRGVVYEEKAEKLGK